MVDVGLLGVKKRLLVTGEFERRRVVDPPITGLDTPGAADVVGLVLLDGEDVALPEEGVDDEVDDEVDEGVEEVEGVVDAMVSEVDVDFAGDAEESVDGEAEAGEGTEVAIGDFDFDLTDGDGESEGVGEGVELMIKEELSETWAL